MKRPSKGRRRVCHPPEDFIPRPGAGCGPAHAPGHVGPGPEEPSRAGVGSATLLALRSPDDRKTFAVLLLPFLLIAASVATSHRARHAVRPSAVASSVSTPDATPSTSVNIALLERELPQPLVDETPLASAGPQVHASTDAQAPPPTPVSEPVARSVARHDPPATDEKAGDVAPPAPIPSGAPRPDGATAEFGVRLAAAARSQTKDNVTYSAKYQSIAYPMGDIPPSEGACSDVVIRAYRTLGIDLQELVHVARVGVGDPSIDHRRTETLRKFFALQSAGLTVTAYPEDYLPGDIVTYHRPFSRVSRAHIAVVSDVIAPTRRPMIVHNRGWGVQLEDALFVDQITGHYRFAGAPVASAPPAHVPVELAVRRVANR